MRSESADVKRGRESREGREGREGKKRREESWYPFPPFPSFPTFPTFPTFPLHAALGHVVLDLDDRGLGRRARNDEGVALATLQLHVG